MAGEGLDDALRGGRAAAADWADEIIRRVDVSLRHLHYR